MRISWKTASLFWVLPLTLLCVFAYTSLKYHLATDSFRHLAEAKVSEFLQAHVTIGQSQPAFLTQVALTDITIDEAREGSESYSLRIEKIVFGYNLLQLLTQNFKNPEVVVLERPRITFLDSSLPYMLLERLHFGSGPAAISGLKIHGGEIRLPTPGREEELFLRHANAELRPLEAGRFSLAMEGVLEGMFGGHIRMAGELDAVKKTQDLLLEVEVKKMDPSVPFPLESFEGKIRWQDTRWFLEQLTGHFYGWTVNLKGEIVTPFLDPKGELDIRIGKKAPLVDAKLSLDLRQAKIRLIFKQLFQYSLSIFGNVHREGRRYRFSQLRTTKGYRGSGELDFRSGDYRFHFKEGRKNIHLVSSLRGLRFNLDLHLDHVDYHGLDLVTLAHIRLEPVRLPWEEHDWKFKGEFHTEYFILEYSPFDDFHGSFEILPYEITHLTTSWGRAFRLYGSVGFKRKRPEAKLEVDVDQFDLRNVREFAAKPLPHNLSGLLDGKLRIEGPLNRPEVIGDFRIKDGRLNKLVYDRAVIHFRGFPPYLALEDSRIFKGRTTLKLTGALDLSLSNMFHGIAVETSDKFLIWKGWEFHAHQKEGEMEINKGGNPLANIALKEEEAGQGITTGTANKPQSEQAIGVATRIKF